MFQRLTSHKFYLSLLLTAFVWPRAWAEVQQNLVVSAQPGLAIAQSLQGEKRNLHNRSSPIMVGEHKRFVFKSQAYGVFSHADAAWDQGKTFLPMQNLIHYLGEKQIERIGLISYAGSPVQHWRTSQVEYVSYSLAGQHNLKFPNLTSLYLAGGNFSLCLCETLRDVLRGIQENKSHHLDVFLVTSAIYDYSSSLNIRVRGRPHDKSTLSEALKSTMTEPEQILKYFKKYLIGEDQVFCPSQNQFSYPNINKSLFLFSVRFNGQQIHISGLETAPYKIQFHLLGLDSQ